MRLKRQFGLDFTYVMIGVNLPENGTNPILDPAIRLFLIMWGFSPAEVIDVFDRFEDDGTRKQLGDIQDAFGRLINYVKDEVSETEKMIIYASAITYLCKNASTERTTFLEILRNAFKMEANEFDKLVDEGSYYAIGLNTFGVMYPK